MGDPATIKDLEGIFERVVTSIIAISGLVLFVLLIAGGFKFLTAGGDPQKAQSAQKTITTAVVGLLVILFAYAIIYLISKLTGASTITEFNITG